MMITNAWNERSDIQAAGSDTEKVDDFCYLGSYMSYNGSCEKDVRVRIGKATSVFGKMKRTWKNKCISLKVKMRLYEAIILSTLLYSAEVWPLTASGVVANLELGERSGVWGRSPQRGPGAEPLVGEAESFFVFGYPKGGAIFHLTSKFCKLHKPHIVQVRSD